MGETDPPARSIKTAVRVFELINTIQALDSPTFTELSDDVEMAESTLYDYLSTLVHLGYVANDEGSYTLTPRFLDHGTFARRQFSIFSKSSETLRQLADESGAAVWLTIEQGGKAVYLAEERGEQSIKSHERLGKHEYMHCLASGKAMLAFSSEEHVQEIVDRHGLPQQTPETISTVEELADELAEIRERGYAINEHEMAAGVAAVAAPVVTGDRVHGAIAIAAPSARMQQESYREHVVELVTTASNEVELKLMYE